MKAAIWIAVSILAVVVLVAIYKKVNGKSCSCTTDGCTCNGSDSETDSDGAEGVVKSAISGSGGYYCGCVNPSDGSFVQTTTLEGKTCCETCQSVGLACTGGKGTGRNTGMPVVTEYEMVGGRTYRIY